MSVADISKIGKAGELVTAANDLVDGLKAYLETGKVPDFTSIFSRLAAIATFISYGVESTKLVKVGIVSNALTLSTDIYKLQKAIKEDNTDEIVVSVLSIVSDITGIVAAIPAPQVKIAAIAIGATAVAIKELYVNRKEIAKYLSDLNSDLALFAKRLKYDPSIYLDLPNSAIRCHVVNGLNMNRGLMYHGAYSQNRLQPHSWRTASNQHRTPTQHPLTADEMRIKQQLISNLQEHPYTYQVFEWNKPGVFELRANRKR